MIIGLALGFSLDKASQTRFIDETQHQTDDRDLSNYSMPNC